MTLDTFLKEWEGKPLDTDGFPADQPFQCVDVAKEFNKELGYPPRAGNGKDWINNAGNDYIQILYKPGAIPLEGDIISWSGNLPNSGGYGHVAVCISGSTNSFVSLDQNWANAHYCRRVEHNYSYVQGWIRPKNYQTGGEDMNYKDITLDADSLYLNWKLFTGREPNAEEASFWTGKTLFQLADSFYANDPSYIPKLQAKQIADLQAQVKALQDSQGSTEPSGKEIPVSNLKSIILK